MLKSPNLRARWISGAEALQILEDRGASPRSMARAMSFSDVTFELGDQAPRMMLAAFQVPDWDGTGSVDGVLSLSTLFAPHLGLYHVSSSVRAVHPEVRWWGSSPTAVGKPSQPRLRLGCVLQGQEACPLS